MEDDPALAASVAIVQSLAANWESPMDLQLHGDSPQVELAGRDTPAKRRLEVELSKLSQRIEKLKTRAQVGENTPEAHDAIKLPLKDDSTGKFYSDTIPASPIPNEEGEDTPDAPGTQDIVLLSNARETLKERLHIQEKCITSARQNLSSFTEQLSHQQAAQPQSLSRTAHKRITRLEQELWRRQRANEAFQNTLQEIGEILTAVACGDLSKKVSMKSVEMDPEITTFKKTINTMMDQLQVFSSEVSRVAHEVGTEGLLGGQAHIEGVDGIWKELTDNGTLCFVFSRVHILPHVPMLTRLPQ